VTQRGAPVELAGIAIGLTLAAIHLVGINISGSSVNPARSLGPAIVGVAHNPEALKQIWLYILDILAPLLARARRVISFDQVCLRPKRLFPPAVKAHRMCRQLHLHLAKLSRGGDKSGQHNGRLRRRSL